MSKPQNTNGGTCPLWCKSCIKVCHDCEFWTHVRGKHPQSGQDLDHWSCAITMIPMLSIENTMAQRQTTASIDAFRNEVHKANDTAMVGAIANLNIHMRDLEQHQLPAFSPKRLIENN